MSSPKAIRPKYIALKSSQRVFVNSTIFRLLVLIPAVIILSLSSSWAQDCKLAIEEKLVQHTCEGMEMGMIKVEVVGAKGKYEIKWNGPGKLTAGTIQSNLKKGRYSIKVIDELGCSDSKTFNIASNALPKVRIAGPNTSKRAGQKELAIQGKSPHRIQWIDSKGKVVSKRKTVGELQEGMYFYTVIDANNCLVGGSVRIQ